MSRLEYREKEQKIPGFSKRAVKVLIYGVSVAAAVYLGIVAGGLYNLSTGNERMPQELIFLNDTEIESVYLFSDITKEAMN
jgi:hypothetical protein